MPYMASNADKNGFGNIGALTSHVRACAAATLGPAGATLGPEAYGTAPAQQRRYCHHYGGDATRRGGATAAQQGGGVGRALRLIQKVAARYDQHMSAKHGVRATVGAVQDRPASR